MTLQDLAAMIRNLHAKYRDEPFDPPYNPQTAVLVEEFTVGAVGTRVCFAHDLATLFHTAFRKGAIHAPLFDLYVVGIIRDNAPPNQMVLSVLNWLEDHGHNLHGPDPNKNPFERLADALEALAAAQNHPVAESAVKVKADAVSVAITMKANDPSLSIRKVAKAVGIPHSTLASSPLWKAAADRLKQIGAGKLRRGSRSTDGKLEAVDD